MTVEYVATALLGVMTCVVLAGIPWAYTVGNNIASMKTQLEGLSSLPTKVEQIGDRTIRLETMMNVDNDKQEKRP